MDTSPEFLSGAESSDAMQAKAEGSGNVNQFKLVVPMTGFMMIVCALLALSVAVNVALFYEYTTVSRAGWVNAYDLQQLKMGPVSYLESEVKTTQDLVQAYGVGKSCRRS